MAFNNQSLILKSLYLQKEIQELNEVCNSQYKAFFEEVREASGEDLLPIFEKNMLEAKKEKEEASPDSKDSSGEILKNKKFKYLYKKIVTISHPDKHSREMPKEQSDNLIKIYNECLDAVKNNDLPSLLSCADRLYLDVPYISEEENELIKSKCMSMESSVEHLKNTYIWKWANAKEEDKIAIIKMFISNNKDKI